MAATTRSRSSAKRSGESSTTTKGATKKSKTTSGDGDREPPSTPTPWYRIFTKGDNEYERYMAQEWGMETRGTNALFERISLEGAQSGLSWLTILRKRDAHRTLFYEFDVERVASMTPDDVERIVNMQDEDNTKLVVRHRGKIESVINNAQCIQQLASEMDGDNDALDSFLWSFVNDKPILNTSWNMDSGLSNAVTQTPESQAMSKALKKKGFRFVGPTTCYALMQATGMVLDHPLHSPEWNAAKSRLESRAGGYQER